MKPGLPSNLISIALGALIASWLVLNSPRLFSTLVWNTLNVAQLRDPDIGRAACAPFSSRADDCLNEVRRWRPDLAGTSFESAWLLFVRGDYDQAAAAVPVTCIKTYTPGASGRRAEYVVVELLAFARRGCVSNAESLWAWMARTAPFNWSTAQQRATLESGAVAQEWLAGQGIGPVAQRQLAAAELWWLADERARAANLISRADLPSSGALTPVERGWASFYLGAFAEDSGDDQAAFRRYTAAIDSYPDLVEATAGQFRLATQAGDFETTRALGQRLMAYTPRSLMPGEGVSLAGGQALTGYDVEPLVMTGPWLHLTLFWRTASTVNGQQVAQRCIQSTAALNLSRFGWSDQSGQLKLVPSPTSSMQPERLSFPMTSATPQPNSFVLYGLQADDSTANVTITVRMLDRTGQGLPDVNQGLMYIIRPMGAAAGSGYGTNAVQWPVGAAEAQVLLTLHAAKAPVLFDRILVTHLKKPDRANVICVGVGN